MDRNREDIANLRSQMHTDTNELSRRMAQCEQQLHDARGVVVVAQKAAHDLSSLLAKAERVSESIDQRFESIDQRDENVKQTGLKFKRVIAEVRRVFDRLRVVAGQTHTVERRAQRVSDQLKSQTDQARKVVEGLTNHLRSIVPIESTMNTSGGIIKEATRRRDEVMPSIVRPLPQQADRTRMMGILDSTRESVAELRGLVDDQSNEKQLSSSQDDPSDVGNGAACTSRLAGEVESLIQMIER